MYELKYPYWDDEIKWHRRFLYLAQHIAQWSKDPSTKVGSVITRPDTQQVIGMGYNGFARGVEDSPERYADRQIKLPLIVHSEVNAIANANQSVRGCDLYTYPTIMWPVCCAECAKLIVQFGIKRVFGWKNDNLSDRWKEQSKYASITLYEGGIEVYSIDPEVD